MKKVMLLVVALATLILSMQSCQQDDNLLNELDTEIQETIAEKTQVVLSENGNTHQRCGSTQHTQQLLQDPDYQRFHQAKFEKLKTVATSRAACSSPTLLPVAVHYQGVSNPDISCLRQLAQSQIDVLNADYQGSNGDISNWKNGASNSFPGISNGEACLEFRLATQNHPSGYGLNNGDVAVTVNQTNGDSNNDWSGYINIFVQPNTGYLGYSPLGGSGNGDGVVVDAAAFGKGSGCGNISPQSPYNLGRTLTHEMGHYLLLDHIWGNGCNVDDDVADTPDQNQEYYDCPNVGQSSCGSTDMHMNYMDYVNDACMYMFSAGQAGRMENYVSSSLANVVNNASNVLGSSGGGGGETPTCNDGIQNGNETGIDCGGSCAPCQTQPTCNDGIQNGDETGIDCGGSCAPCQTQAECTAPTNSQVTTLSETSVQVSWMAVNDAIKYQIRYREVGGSWLRKGGTSTQKNLTNLFPGATYEYQLRSRCSDNQWTAWSSKSTFTLYGGNGGGGTNGCTNITLRLTLDDYGSETYWDVEDANGNVVATGGPYSDYQAGVVKTKSFCLDAGCYTFVMYDAYGDGICCDYGEGSYQLLDNNGGLIAASDGYFGTYEEIGSCTTSLRQAEKNEVRRDAKKVGLAKKK